MHECVVLGGLAIIGWLFGKLLAAVLWKIWQGER